MDTSYYSNMDPAVTTTSSIVGIVFYLIAAWFISRIFVKAGIEAWKGWVPLVNTWHLFKLGGFGGWWAILALIPIVNIAAIIVFWIAEYRIGKGFGKSGAWVILAILLHIVWLGILAFDSSRWVGTPESKYPPRG
jgi:hypothetical protein